MSFAPEPTRSGAIWRRAFDELYRRVAALWTTRAARRGGEPRFAGAPRPIPALNRPALAPEDSREPRRLALLLILSLLLHAGLLLLAELFAGRAEHVIAQPIPVQLVMAEPKQEPAPPPPAKPPPEASPQQPKPPAPPPKPPPPGRLASDELGNPDASGKTPTSTSAPAAGQVRSRPGEASPPPANAPETPSPSEIARPKPPPDEPSPSAAPQQQLPDTPSKMALGGVFAPPEPSLKPEPKVDHEAARPTPKPSPVRMVPVQLGGPRRPTRTEDPDRAEGHKAKYPGPDASPDEYLAYIRDLTNEHLQGIPLSYVQGRQGVATFEVLIRPNGSIVWFAMTKSSGYADADAALKTALNTIDRFPPLPPELLHKGDTPTELTYSVPLAAIERHR